MRKQKEKKELVRTNPSSKLTQNIKKKASRQVDKKEEKKLLWLGAQRLMSKPKTQQEERERRLILLTAKVLNISPFGVNILGTVPYINKLGWAQKVEQYKERERKQVYFQYHWKKMSQDETDKAICLCRITDGKGKPLTDWIVGECSPATMKMGTLKGYQNHMAQTRARNRASWELLGVAVHEEMMANIEKMYRQKEITDKEANQLKTLPMMTSAEEIQEEKPQSQKTLFAGDGETEELKHLAREAGASTGKEEEFIEKLTGIKPDWANLTKKQVSILKASLLSKGVKR